MTTQTPPTIPADDFGLDGDRAWWIVDAPQLIGRPHRAEYPDRPCDRQCIKAPAGRDWWDGYDTHLCDCIDGRHTWNIEVDEQVSAIAGKPADIWTFRVSVVPGMVLPIVGLGGDSEPPHILIGHRKCWLVRDAATPVEWVNLPDGKKPGRFAVLLNVQPVSE